LDNLPIKDIKPIVDISDYSFYYFIIVVVLCLVGIIFLIKFLYQKYKKPKYSFNLTNSKQTAYKLIKIIREKEGSEEYIKKLHNYTYKKEVPPFDEKLFDEIIKKFKINI